MDIPYLMTKLADDSKGIIESKIEILNLSQAKKNINKEVYDIFMIFDLDSQCIRFEAEKYIDGDSERKYKNLISIRGNVKQIYATQSSDRFNKYLQKGLMYNIYDILPDKDLKELLNECYHQGLFNEESINLKIVKAKNENCSFDLFENKIIFQEKEISTDNFLKLVIDAHTNQSFGLIVPTILKDGKKHIISQDNDYIKLIESSFNKKSKSKKKNNKLHEQGVCHICGKRRDIIPEVNFGSTSITKIFVTTPINYASNFSRSNHAKNYAVCQDCYSKILKSENALMSGYSIKVAGENTVLLFEGFDKEINQLGIDKIKNGIDFVFNSDNVSEWSNEQLTTITEDIGSQLYQFSMIFYKPKGNAGTKITKTIDSISSIRFAHILDIFAQCRRKIGETFFSLGDVYRIIPVANDKSGSQLNVKRVLDLYSAIVKGERVDKSVIYDYACEALDRGYKQIRSQRDKIYKNQIYKNLSEISKQINSSPKHRQFDNYAANTVYKYLMLFDALEELKIIDRKVYKMENENNTQALGFLADYESFLDKQEFSPAQRGLFYIGCLINQIGYAQFNQGHKTKPILDKITYQGMTHQDVLRLYLDALEKTRQYKGHINMYLCDGFENRIHHYLGNLEESKLLNDKENVFFIMAGYAYCVKNIKKNNNEEDENND